MEFKKYIAPVPLPEPVELSAHKALHKCGDYRIKHEVLIYQHPISKCGISPDSTSFDPILERYDSLWKMAVNYGYAIWSLRRLIDGQEFTVGQEVDVEKDKKRVKRGKITAFSTQRGRMIAEFKKGQEYLSDIYNKTECPPQVQTSKFITTLDEILKVTGRSSNGPYGRALKKLIAAKLNIVETTPIILTKNQGKQRGGQSRSEWMTPEKRSTIAKKAAVARWSGGL